VGGETFRGVQPWRDAGLVFGETGGEDIGVDVSSAAGETDPAGW